MTKLVRAWIGGARQNVPRIFIWVGGARQKVKKGYIWVGGARQLFFQSDPVLVGSSSSFVTSSAVCTAQIQFRTDGYVYEATGAGGTFHQDHKWLISGSPGDYQIRAHTFTGSPGVLTAGPTTFTSLATQQSFTRQSVVANNLADVAFVIEIVAASNPSVILSTGSGSLGAERYI